MIEYIKYKEKKWPVRVSYYVLKKMQLMAGGKIGTSDDVTSYEKMLYYALQAGCKAENLDFPFKEEDMEDVLDECFFEFVGLLPKFFPTNSEVSKLLGENAPQAEK